MIRAGTATKLLLMSVFTAGCFPVEVARGKDANDSSWLKLPEIETHGFYEARAGYRTRKDKHAKDMSIMESRLQLDLYSYLNWGDLRVKGDVFGDLIFINDLFPKDWNSFFIGRDNEYLKAPSDAIKVSLFGKWANLDIVYTPQFDPDRYIDGRRLSYWSSPMGSLAGDNAIVHTDRPDHWFRDNEIAARLYKNIKNYEVALYGYRGFWKSPAGLNAAMNQALFPDLNVYGASVRGAVGKGIGNMEVGHYDSADDASGKNALLNNSEMRYLAGYTQEIGRDLTLGLQYYVEQMLDYHAYKRSLTSGPAGDQYRHLTTLRLTKLLMNQNLRLSLFTYYSPSDNDAHLRPNIHYKVNDNLSWEMGANIFFGDYPSTFFGQFESNTNIYTGPRYSF